jgi:Fe-S-cluster containining protein
MSPDPWYRDGLRFTCTRCGHCCTGEPGTVRVSEEEAAELARVVGLDLADFYERYTRLLDDGSTSLTEKPDHACVFWSASAGCTVYAARPRQCRTWPFWRRNLASPAHWTAAARACPGIGRGELHAGTEIACQAEHDGTSGVLPDA